jgi:hypothetical protein
MTARLNSDAPFGFDVYLFGPYQHRWKEAKDILLRGMGIEPRFQDRRDLPAVTIPKSASNSKPFKTTTGDAMKLWQKGNSVKDTLVPTYFQFRCLELTDYLADQVLRFLPEGSIKGRKKEGAKGEALADYEWFRGPMMLTLARHALTNDPISVQKTMLRPGGFGNDKSIPGGPRRLIGVAPDAVAKVSPDDQVQEVLHITEGLEDAVSARQLGFSPVWATLGTGTMQDLSVIDRVKTLIVFADRDPKSKAGMKAAKLVRAKWETEGKKVHIWRPPPGVKDLNELLVSRVGAGADGR